MSNILNPKLYEKAKKEADKKYEWFRRDTM